MRTYVLSRKARRDYFAAFDYIEGHNARAALKWERIMLDVFDHLAAWPHSGRVRPEYAPAAIRFWTVGDYLILYDLSTDPLSIVTILHGSQELEELIAQSIFEYEEDREESK